MDLREHGSPLTLKALDCAEEVEKLVLVSSIEQRMQWPYFLSHDLFSHHHPWWEVKPKKEVQREGNKCEGIEEAGLLQWLVHAIEGWISYFGDSSCHVVTSFSCVAVKQWTKPAESCSPFYKDSLLLSTWNWLKVGLLQRGDKNNEAADGKVEQPMSFISYQAE